MVYQEQPRSEVTEINIGKKAGASPLVIDKNTLTEALLKSGLEKQESEKEQDARLCKELWAFGVTLAMKSTGFIVLLAVLTISISVALNPNTTESAKAFSEKTITGVVGAITGFSIGKGGK